MTDTIREDAAEARSDRGHEAAWDGTRLAAETATAPSPGWRPGKPTEPRRDFRRYLAGDAASTAGSVFTGVATSVLAVTVFHASGVQVGLLAAASTVPMLLAAPLAGVLADCTRRPRRLLIAADLAAAAIVGACGLGILAGIASFAWLVGLGIGLGLIQVVSQNLFFTHLNSLSAGNLSSARASLQTASYVANSSANAAAGPVVGLLGPAAMLATDAVTYLFSAASLRSIRAPDRNPAHDPARAPASLRRDLAEGIRILARSRLRPVVGYALLAQSAFAGATALKSLFLLRVLGLPPALYTVPGFCAALLGVVGSLLAARLLHSGREPGRVATLWWAGGALAASLLPASGGPTAVAVLICCVGLAVPVMCGAAANVAFVKLFSEAIPERAMGRVNAFLMVVVTLATVAGALTAGWVADLVGVRTALCGAALLSIVSLPLLRPLLRADTGGPEPVERA